MDLCHVGFYLYENAIAYNTAEQRRKLIPVKHELFDNNVEYPVLFWRKFGDQAVGIILASKIEQRSLLVLVLPNHCEQRCHFRSGLRAEESL
jgi:hypothetical protein